MFDVKVTNLENLYDSVSGLTYIFNVPNTVIQAINKIIVLTISMCQASVVSIVIIQYSSCPKYSVPKVTEMQTVA